MFEIISSPTVFTLLLPQITFGSDSMPRPNLSDSLPQKRYGPESTEQSGP
jgi:hypothetical protein